jgi:predicted nucleic acid-binding Zn ribbon protein
VVDGFFVRTAMIYPVKCKRCGAADDIEKPMHAAMPSCPSCGGELRRVWLAADMPAVVYGAGGFYSTDYARFERQVGGRRAAQFRAAKDDAEGRAKRGRLTAYERALEDV